MYTAIQLRDDHDLRCLLLYGSPISRRVGRLGEIALFDADQVVIYCVITGRSKKAFAFRTGLDGSVTVPGVLPGVELLCEAKSRGKVTRLMQVVCALERKGIALHALPEGFFVRLNTMLNDREFAISNAIGLLSHAKL